MQMVRLDPRERWVFANATHFVACAFRGRGKYERIVCVDLEGAREAARTLVKDRPVAGYAVAGRYLAASQACVELVEP